MNNEAKIMELEDQINVAGVNTELELPTILQGWSDALIEENIQFDSEGNLKVKKLEAKIIELKENENPPECGSEIEGSFYYDFNEKAFFGCDGNEWQKIQFVPKSDDY